jgi:hypothetical protein
LSNIRVTYSGLISLVLGLSSTVTGLIFILIVTRSLSQTELGVWTLIGGLFTYVLVLEPIISYWSLRQVARGNETGKTAIISSGIFSIFGLIGYVLISFLVFEKTNTPIDILLYAIPLVPLHFLNRTISTVALGWKPQLDAYGIVILDLVKIPTAIIFIYYLDLGIIGVINSMIISYSITITILVYLSRERFRNKFSMSYVKSWLKFSWIPIFSRLPGMIVFDVMIFSVITGSVTGLAYWTTALAASSLTRHTNQLAKALYGKLLGGGKKQHMQENLQLFLYFSFPFMAISITFSKSILFALNPIYAIGSLIVIILTLRSFLSNLDHIFLSALKGIETVDVKDESTFKDYINSNLFKIPKIRFIHKIVYWTTLSLGLYLFINIIEKEVELIVLWALITLFSQLPFTFYFFLKTKRQIPFNVDFKRIVKYILATLVIYIPTFIFVENYFIHEVSIFEFLPKLIGLIILTFSAYVLLTYVIEKNSRKLINMVILELKKWRKKYE